MIVFTIISVLFNFLAEIDESLYITTVSEALLKFMEMSSVGDFELRLKMLKAFHVEMNIIESTGYNKSPLNGYMYNAPPPPAEKHVSDFLGNILNFYMQFSSAVSKSIQELLEPLEKEFKVR